MAGVLAVTDISRKLAKVLTDEYKRYGHVKALLDLWKNNIKKKFWYRSAALPSRWGTSSSKRRSGHQQQDPCQPPQGAGKGRQNLMVIWQKRNTINAHILSMGKKTI
jgi:hypothetical protein